MMNYSQADQEAQGGPNGQATNAPTLRTFLESTNIAETLDEQTLQDISDMVSEGFEYDLLSRQEWEKNLDAWTNLALQVKEEKNFPWRDASNVKYPLLSTAAMQFNARAYPSLVPATGDIVKCEVVGYDPTGEKLEQAKSNFGNVEVRLQNPEYEDWISGVEVKVLTLNKKGINTSEMSQEPVNAELVNAVGIDYTY